MLALQLQVNLRFTRLHYFCKLKFANIGCASGYKINKFILFSTRLALCLQQKCCLRNIDRKEYFMYSACKEQNF